MKKNGLTMSLIIECGSANYGEGFGNISPLKKLTRGSGEVYTYISRQALRYNIIQQMGCDSTPVEVVSSKKVLQFHSDADIVTYPEIDLFGYMKTDSGEKATTRSAVVRLSNAISLEPYAGDTDYLTNMGLAARKKDADNSIAQSEIHQSFYAYTVAIDLDRVGIDEVKGKIIAIENSEKVKRVQNLLDTIMFLYRDIKGRRENLSPVFVIGGVYERKNPFFENRLQLFKGSLKIEIIKQVLDSDDSIKENTEIGYLAGTFRNDKDVIEQLKPVTIREFFENLKRKVEEVYR
ncbi:type I-B CRISPR-associated protein Cas7/Cst2/DevR [Thermoclostridium stercorarium subsp. leptospartum DSM 9219]|uniref:Type I-B CRISPR-associated protein Cas7/Cst2/DevR n=1 Tax=Thermoclostridium stercorarium subsp. leptospartum DSM 9219 TaxID=1346611 RepID=A0A1B1YL45_THEST|nr:type I-B CRISPR-associated protein Cas7/Cst2/DevR [Thermoclostridium stercorarium]ANX01509.1 type I-B CRISPR-associated protein Cas7/Cst2/DevR [Thermoclostridium stercorarium subsp. leptospartum DSM 9219]